MGRMAVAIMLESPKISSFTAADKDYEKAKIFTEMVGSKLIFKILLIHFFFNLSILIIKKKKIIWREYIKENTY